MPSMQSILAAALSCAALCSAAALPPSKIESRATRANPFLGHKMYANPQYSNEVMTSSVPKLSTELAAKAKVIADVPSFFWLDSEFC